MCSFTAIHSTVCSILSNRSLEIQREFFPFQINYNLVSSIYILILKFISKYSIDSAVHT